MSNLLDSLCDKLKLKKLENIPQLKEISEKTHVKPAYFGLLVLSILSLLVLLEIGGYWIAFSVGSLYPAWASFKVISTRYKEDNELWLSYWTVFGIIQVFDKILYTFFSCVPFYSALKIALFIYLYHPKTLGALVLYQKLLRPMLLSYEGQEFRGLAEEEALRRSKNAASEGIGDFDMIKKDE